MKVGNQKQYVKVLVDIDELGLLGNCLNHIATNKTAWKYLSSNDIQFANDLLKKIVEQEYM